MLQELLKQSPTLITTGGGIVLRRENVELMQRHGWVVALFAEPEVLIQRLAHDQTRPMLQGDVRGRILQIVEERAGKYDFADLQVDTSTRQPDEVVAQIASFWNKKQV